MSATTGRHERTCVAPELGPAFCSCPEPLIGFDPTVPTFEVWLDGRCFARTQIPARFRDTLDALTSPAAAKRYGNREVGFRVVNGRRQGDL